MILVTGAFGHFHRSLFQLLRSLHGVAHVPERVLVYDLGLPGDAVERLEREHPGVELRRHEFEGEPEFMKPSAGTYGWKPLLLAGLAEELQAPFLWLDSATVVLGSLRPVEAELERVGVWAPFAGGGPVRAHARAVEYLSEKGIDPSWTGLRSRAAGVCAFDPTRPEIAALLARWRELARVQECLAPPGSARGNHNFDQTILVALLYDGQQRGAWTLGQDELDISSSRPVDFLMARAVVPPWLPPWLDPAFLAWRRLARCLDVLQWRVRRSGTPLPAPDQPVR
jgi:hypothetical protein